MSKLKSQNIRRIVVRGTNWVGDAVMTVPALRELRRLFPDAHITLATRSWAKGLFDDSEFLNALQVHETRGLKSVIQQVRDWRKGNFDLAVLFTNSFEAAFVAALAGVPIRIGYATDNRRPLLTQPLELPESRNSEHEVFYYLRIVAALEWLVNQQQTFLDTEPNCSLTVNDARKSDALALLQAKGARAIAYNQPLVALCPGSINSRAKRWPAERYSALGDQLIEKLGADVILIGSREELDVSREVAARMRNKPVLLTGETDLSEAVAVLSLVDLLITNDTGPAHIASALQRRTIVIFGPTNPLTTRPFSPLAEILREPPDCAPCMLRDCPIDHRCMTAISPETVFERAAALLNHKLPFATCQERSPLGAAIDKLKFAGQ